MSFSLRAWLAAAVFAATAWNLSAQDAPGDRPTSVQPRTPQTRAELDHREALKLFARGLALERDNLLLEAARTYERAVELDPDANEPRKALAPIYLALDRIDDALAVCHQVVQRDPGDFETWYLVARQYRAINKLREAADALTRAAGTVGIKDRPELRVQVALDLGSVHEGLGDFARAEAAYATVTTLLEDPESLIELGVLTKDEAATQSAEAYERLGKMAVRAGHADQAVAAFRKAQDKDPNRRLRLEFNLADLLISKGQFEAALERLGNYLRTQPPGTEAYELEIKILKQLGRANQILPILQAHSQADAENLELKLLLARESGRAGQVREAETIFTALLEKTTRPDVYRGLFELYQKQGEIGGAQILTRLNQAVQAASDNPNQAPNPADQAVNAARARAMLAVLRDDPGLVKLLLPAARPQMAARWGNPGLHPETRRFLAVLAARTRQLEDAETLYRSCLQDGGFGRRGESELYSGLLRVLWQGHKYEAIVKVCQDGLANAQMTNRVLFHLDLSRAWILLDKPEEALAQAEEAVKLSGDAERLVTARNRVMILAQAGKLAEAEAKALELFKEFTQPDEILEVRYALSQVYSLAKNHAKSEEQLRLIIKDHPDDPTAHNDLGYSWADRNENLAEAEKLIRRALQLDHDQRANGKKIDADAGRANAAYVDSLGWVLFRQGKLAEAKAELEKAVQLPEGADDPVVWDHLGDVLSRLGEREQARAKWTRALEIMETTRRRKGDDREKDLRTKLRLLEQTPAPR